MDIFTNPSLDARLHGILFENIPVGSSQHEWLFPFDCNFNGAVIYSDVNSMGSTISLETQYNSGAYGWKRYKKFGKDWNLFPNHAHKTLLFPTKPKQGIKLVIDVENNSNSTINIGMNLYLFVDSEIVNPNQLQEGTDW